MLKEAFLNNIERHVSLNDADKRIIRAYFELKNIKQGSYVAHAGDTAKHFIYVASGCLMYFYSDNEGNDQVLQFPVSGWWTGDLLSLSTGKTSHFAIKALADSEILLITKSDLDELVKEVPVLERFFRIIFQNSLIAHQQRLVQNFSLTAEERYLSFQEKYPTLEQFVPQKYIASYLGITPEFLSKVRRNLMKSKS